MVRWTGENGRLVSYVVYISVLTSKLLGPEPTIVSTIITTITTITIIPVITIIAHYCYY